MISAILSLLASPLIGSIFGSLFGVWNRKLDIEQRSLDRAHELALRDKDMEQARIEAEGKLQIAIQEGDARVESARMAALAAAYQSMAGQNDFIDKVSRGVRPIATYVLMAGAMTVNGVFLWMLRELWPTLAVGQRTDLVIAGVGWVLTQASGSMSFWFAQRSPPPPRRS